MRLGFEHGGIDWHGAWTQEMKLWFLHTRGYIHYRLRLGDIEVLPKAGLYTSYAFHYRIINSDGRDNRSGFGFARYPDLGIALGVDLRIRERFQIGASYNHGIISNYTMINLAYFWQ